MVSRTNRSYLETMFPTLSITLIGLLLGAAVMVVTRRRDWTTLLAAVIGGWAGFGVGAFLGVVVDIVSNSGMWVALAGHVLALIGAAIAVRLRLARVVSAGR